MKNVTKPRTVSFEDALRNLATKLTGTPLHELPRTQEGVVQYMAEAIPSVEELAEDITQEVLARLAQAQGTDDEQDPPADGEPEPPAGEGEPQDLEPPADQPGETETKAPEAPAPAKSGRSRKSK